MAKTDKEVKLFMKHRETLSQELSAAKVGMTAKTGRKYEKSGLLPSQNKQVRTYKTRANPFAEHSRLIEDKFKASPKLHARTILMHLMTTFPDANYNINQLRTLERRIQPLRLLYGCEKEIYFPQEIRPGIQSQSDWTNMNSLAITVDGNTFPHLLFHLMLPYSCWESVDICYSESFDSLANGYQKAVRELGFSVALHKTDNSSTATKKARVGRDYTNRYEALMSHYQVRPIKNNPGKGNENGSVEKSHDLFKTAVDQALMLRGSRNFDTLQHYTQFLENLVNLRNSVRKIKTDEEKLLLQALPPTNYSYTESYNARVNKLGMVTIDRRRYSVPTKLIGKRLNAEVDHRQIRLYSDSILVSTLPKSEAKITIDYRHIIDSLIRKPGAFDNYKYRDLLYPQLTFKQAYEVLEANNRDTCVKLYLRTLKLAKDYGEDKVSTLLKNELTNNTILTKVHIDKIEQSLIKPGTLKVNLSNMDFTYQNTLNRYDSMLKWGAQCI